MYLLDLNCLEELKLDYFILCSQDATMDVVIHHASENVLKKLEITFDDIDTQSRLVKNEKWQAVEQLCPKLHISFVLSMDGRCYSGQYSLSCYSTLINLGLSVIICNKQLTLSNLGHFIYK